MSVLKYHLYCPTEIAPESQLLENKESSAFAGMTT